MKVNKQKTFDERYAVQLPEDLPWKILSSLAHDLGVSQEPSLYGAIRNRDYRKLFKATQSEQFLSTVSETVGKSHAASRFFVIQQLRGFLKKFPFKGSKKTCKEAAIAKFFEAEKSCELFNKENYKALLAVSEKHPDFFGIIEEIQDDILSLLGPVPQLDSVYYHAAHGPGVSLSDSYKEGSSTEFFKWSVLPYSVTVGTRSYAISAISADPRWIGALDDWYRQKCGNLYGPINMDSFWNTVLEIVPGSRITTVPKTAEIDRTIAIEPVLNVYLQLGVDHIIKSLLKRWGCDLTSQEKNQLYALEGSLYGLLATLDLSMASDTIALLLCALFLPPAWYDLLFDLRSPQGEIDGQTVLFEKISSMGNGYTFALESLIFSALARCAIRRTGSERKFAVYGDDIVVPVTAFSYLRDLLGFCGFKVNEQKTFADGPFRESCGKDYFHGYDVRPVFLKRPLRNVQDLLYLHNALYSLKMRLHWAWGFEFQRTLDLVSSYIPVEVRNRFGGPISETWDTHYFSDCQLSRDHNGYRFHLAILVKPTTVKIPRQYRSFYFRKLMSQLKNGSVASEKWRDVRRSMAGSGNAFTITRRDHVVMTWHRVYIQ